jgi:hypothetical protein
MDEHLTKPLDLKKFKTLLGNLIAALQPSPDGAQAPSEKAAAH